jgi:DNA-binding response OmpR family regulator
MRVLLVHSEPLTGDVIAAMLRHRGYNVAQAPTAQEAVLRCARHEADVVFLAHLIHDGHLFGLADVA